MEGSVSHCGLNLIYGTVIWCDRSDGEVDYSVELWVECVHSKDGWDGRYCLVLRFPCLWFPSREEVNKEYLLGWLHEYICRRL